MHIKSIQIENFRNISSTMLAFSKKFNAIYGDNASGKTSILEAIHYLSTGRSARGSLHESVINNQSQNFTLFSNIVNDNTIVPIGMSRNREGDFQLHLREEKIRSIGVVSEVLPMIFIASDSHRILTDGPKTRRQFLDWGLFYTCPQFYPQWRQYQKLLTQRNAALKDNVSRETLICWSKELAEAGEAIDQMRNEYLKHFLPIFKETLAALLPSKEISTTYSHGWNVGSLSLLECLTQKLFKEIPAGHTLYGPHRADLVLTVDNLSITEILSQGQQKLVSYALKIAQGIDLKSSTSKPPIYLIDDLPSELDAQKQVLATKILSDINSQVFITGIHQTELEKLVDNLFESKMFHVKHGVVEEVEAKECV